MQKRQLVLGVLFVVGIGLNQVGFAKKPEHVKYQPISKKLKFPPKAGLPAISDLTEKQLLEQGYQPIGVVSVVLREYHCAKKYECKALPGDFDATRLAREKAAEYGADAVTLWSDNRDFLRERGPTGLARLAAPKNCTRRPDYSGPIQPGQTKYKVDCVVEADFMSRTLFVESRAISWHKSRSDKGWENTKKAVEQLNKLFKKTHGNSYRRAIGFGYEAPEKKVDPGEKTKLSRRDRRDNLDQRDDLPRGLAAVWSGDIETVKAQLASGELLAEKTKAGHTALHYAAAAGHAGVIKLLLRNGMPVAPRNRYGATPLYLAARYGQGEAVRALLAAGADINEQSLNFMDLTAAMAAAKYGHSDMLWDLLARGADIERKDKEGKGVLAHAVGSGRNELIAPLLQKYDPQQRARQLKSALYVAVLANNAEGVAVLLEQGARVDYRYTPAISGDYTPLLLAVVDNHLETVDVLLKAGADPGAGTGVGTPLSLNLKTRENSLAGAMDRNAAVAMSLLRAGANADKPRIIGKLFIPKPGQSSSHELLIAYLLEGSALSENSLGVLYRSAVRAGRLDYMRKIIDKAGGDVVDPEDPKVFYAAVGSGSIETVEFLLVRGMPIDAALNRERETALILAAKYGDKDMVEFLLARGASVTKTNNRQRTAYDIAYDSKQLRIVKVIAAVAGSVPVASK